jgi:hypothetical protein
VRGPRNSHPSPRCLWCFADIVGTTVKKDGTYWRHLIGTELTTFCPDGVTIAEPIGGHPDDEPALEVVR